MQIDQIPLDRLSVSKANMRSGKKPPDIADILPSVIKRGVLSPLFVRPNCQDGHFEIVAGKRRYFAGLEAAKQGQDEMTLPCIVIAEGDDADALEVSMIENLMRQDPDPVTQWESFTRLVKEGRSVEDIAATFALTELQVKRILALGNLSPRIREAYRAEEIDAATVKHLTLASKAQQKAWLALFEDADAYGLGSDPFDPRDNILAGTSYLRELYDSYGTSGFLAAYNAGPGRYEDWRDRSRPLPAETRSYVAKIAPMLQLASAPTVVSGAVTVQPVRRFWTQSQLFAVRGDAEDGASGSFVTAAPPPPNLAPSRPLDGLFAPVSGSRSQ